MAKTKVGYDPVEDAKVSGPPGARGDPGAPPPPPPVGTSVPVSDADMERIEKERRKLEGTPVHYAEPPPVLIPPAPYVPPPAEARWLVKATRIVNFNGQLTTLAKGSIVSESSHNMRVIREHGVELEPV